MTVTDTFTGTYTDRHFIELASKVVRRGYFTSYTFESPSGLVWLTVTVEVHSGSWLASTSNVFDDCNPVVGRGGSDDLARASELVDWFLGD